MEAILLELRDALRKHHTVMIFLNDGTTQIRLSSSQVILGYWRNSKALFIEEPGRKVYIPVNSILFMQESVGKEGGE